jgi:hypothetical protein
VLRTGSDCSDGVQGDQKVLANGNNRRAQSHVQNPGGRSRDIVTMAMLRERRCHTSMSAQRAVRLDAHGRTVLQSGSFKHFYKKNEWNELYSKFDAYSTGLYFSYFGSRIKNRG